MDQPAATDAGPAHLDSIGVLTSGGDAPGMNAAVRAVVRTALHEGVEVYFIREGYRGMVDGGPAIQPASSEDVGGILQRGGTIIGTARSQAFMTREGRRAAAKNLLEHGINGLIVVGGDGSLVGANVFRSEWPDLLQELVESGEVDAEAVRARPHLKVVGLVGSIDNDMFGTDMTIGADTALHRITEAIDAIHATAASHQRSFVIEVMGRNCGYLALMSSLAAGANGTFIPEHPPESDDWETALRTAVEAGRRIGRRQNIVVVAEGARDRHGQPITVRQVQAILDEGLGEDTRVTILGHVQRGGAPSAFDRNLSTQCGYRAVHELLRMQPDDEPKLVGIREHRITASPLMDAITRTYAVADHLAKREYDAAMSLRGGSFAESFEILRTLVRAQPSTASEGEQGPRIAVLHAGAPAPGMNTAVRAAVRLGMDHGCTMLRVDRGFEGLREGHVRPFDWMSVSGWVSRGGAELGTSQYTPRPGELGQFAAQLEAHHVDGLLMIGGLAGYAAVHAMHQERARYPQFDIPMVCLPATINNDVPATELSIGSDTALNSIASDVDKIKQSAVASRRCFIVEVMGKDSGYLALLSGLVTGAERVYLPEEGITLDQLRADVMALTTDFRRGQRLGLLIRNERADAVYTTPFMWALFEKEGGDLFDVRQAILGHLQQGGDPSPFDRIQATRLAARCIGYLVDAVEARGDRTAMVGLQAGRVTFTAIERFPELMHPDRSRPVDQSWLADLRPIADVMSLPLEGAAPPTPSQPSAER